jgi:hypothetical protein
MTMKPISIPRKRLYVDQRKSYRLVIELPITAEIALKKAAVLNGKTIQEEVRDTLQEKYQYHYTGKIFRDE